MGFIFNYNGKNMVLLRKIKQNGKDYFVVPKGTKVPSEWTGTDAERKLHTQYRKNSVVGGVTTSDLLFDAKHPSNVGSFLYGKSAPARSIVEVDLTTGKVIRYLGKEAFPEKLPTKLNISWLDTKVTSKKAKVLAHSSEKGTVTFGNKNTSDTFTLPLCGTTITTKDGLTIIDYSDHNYISVEFAIPTSELTLSIDTEV